MDFVRLKHNLNPVSGITNFIQLSKRHSFTFKDFSPFLTFHHILSPKKRELEESAYNIYVPSVISSLVILHRFTEDRARQKFEISNEPATYRKGVSAMSPISPKFHLTSSISLKAGYSVLSYRSP